MFGLGLIIKSDNTGVWTHIGLIAVLSIHIKNKNI